MPTPLSFLPRPLKRIGAPPVLTLPSNPSPKNSRGRGSSASNADAAARKEERGIDSLGRLGLCGSFSASKLGLVVG